MVKWQYRIYHLERYCLAGNEYGVDGGAISGQTEILPGTLTAANFAPTGVVPGTYTSANISVNAQGQVLAASDGSGGSGAPNTATYITQADETLALPNSLKILSGTHISLVPSGNTLTINAAGGGSGSVTNIATGTGLSGGPITTTGTISIANSTINSLAGYDITGTFSNVTIGANLTLSGGILTAAGSSGDGTVTSIATNNGLTGGTITTSGTIGLASIANNFILANTSGISADAFR